MTVSDNVSLAWRLVKDGGIYRITIDRPLSKLTMADVNSFDKRPVTTEIQLGPSVGRQVPPGGLYVCFHS